MDEIIDQTETEVETTPAETEVELDQPAESETPPEETPVVEEEPLLDLEDVDYEGKKYSLPREIKDALLRQADYTRKTQEVAEQRKQIEAAQQHFKQVTEAQRQNFQEHVQLAALDQALEQYKQVDFQQWIDTDPNAAQKAFFQFEQIRTAREQLAQTLSQKEQQRTLEAQQGLAKRQEEYLGVLNREFGWNGDKAIKTKEYLETYKHLGVSDRYLAELNAGVHGVVPVILAHKAHLYDQMVQKAKAKPTTPPAKPAAKVDGKATVSKAPDKMTDKEFAEWRRKQIAQRNKH